jgi:hypothetical protein
MERHKKRLGVAAAACVFAAFASTAWAQQQATTTEVKKFEVLSVDGNRVVVRGEKGETQEITVPDDFRFNVNGQMVPVTALKPGMKGSATITTTTTTKPVRVTEVRNGEVIQANGGSILVRTATGYRMFTQGDVEKRGVQVMKDGKPIDISQLHTGDRLTATIITEGPPQVLTERQVQATVSGAAPPPPAARPAPSTAPSAGGAAAPSTPPRAGAGTAPAAGAAPAAAAPGATAPAKKLPKTASPLPLVLMTGAISLALGIGLTTIRRRRAGR